MRKHSKTNIFLNIHRWPRITSWKIKRVQWTIKLKRKHLQALIYAGLEKQVSFKFFFQTFTSILLRSCTRFFFQKLFGTSKLYFAANCISKSFTAKWTLPCLVDWIQWVFKMAMEILIAHWLTWIMLPIEDVMLKMQPMISNGCVRYCPCV